MKNALIYLFQSITSEKGIMYPSATITGIQPAFMASDKEGWASRAPLIITQNVESCMAKTLS